MKALEKTTEPLRWAVLVPVVLTALIAAGQAFLDGEPVRGIIAAAIGALIAAATEYVRHLVTPTLKLTHDKPRG